MASRQAAPVGQDGSTVDEPDVTIALDPHRAGRAFVRLVEYGKPVWAIIAYYKGFGGDVARTAEAHAIPEEAVRAAVAHYEADPRYIDAFLLLNDDAFESH
jgi:hypothetical protein